MKLGRPSVSRQQASCAYPRGCVLADSPSQPVRPDLVKFGRAERLSRLAQPYLRSKLAPRVDADELMQSALKSLFGVCLRRPVPYRKFAGLVETGARRTLRFGVVTRSVSFEVARLDQRIAIRSRPTSRKSWNCHEKHKTAQRGPDTRKPKSCKRILLVSFCVFCGHFDEFGASIPREAQLQKA